MFFIHVVDEKDNPQRFCKRSKLLKNTLVVYSSKDVGRKDRGDFVQKTNIV
jgi:hypothetical protein